MSLVWIALAVLFLIVTVKLLKHPDLQNKNGLVATFGALAGITAIHFTATALKSLGLGSYNAWFVTLVLVVTIWMVTAIVVAVIKRRA